MAWNAVGSIRGPQGVKGDKGDKGDTGDAGADGAGIEIAGSVNTYANLPDDLTALDAGLGYLVQSDGKLYIWDGAAFPNDGDGAEFRGPKGDTGAAGSDGADGDSAYEIAVAGGFVGSETAWLASLKGEKGDTGTTGTTGDDGASAYQVAVQNGFPGSESAWLDSLKGAKGDTGSKGDTGDTGSTGQRGSRWYTGVGAPSTIGGSLVGDMYLDTATGDTYQLT